MQKISLKASDLSENAIQEDKTAGSAGGIAMVIKSRDLNQSSPVV